MEIQVTSGKITRNLRVRKGENLLRVLLRNGVEISHSCHGKGKCGKCGVRVSPWERVTTQSGEGPADTVPEVQKGRKKLACLVNVDQPISVHTEAKWTGGKKAAGKQAKDSCAPMGTPTVQVHASRLHEKASCVTEGAPTGTVLKPPCKRVCVTLPPEGASPPLSEWERLVAGFHGKDRKVLRRAMEQILSVPDALFPLREGVVTMTRAGRHFIGIEAGDATKGRVGIAILIHGGTLYGILVSLETNRLLLADVVPYQQEISEVMLSFCEKAGAKVENLTDVVVAAETGVLHVLTGLPWDINRRAQDTPVVLAPRVLAAQTLAWPIARHAGVWIAPSASAAHGADLVMEVLPSPLYSRIADVATDAFAMSVQRQVPENMPHMLAGVLGCLLDKKMRRLARKIAGKQSLRHL